MKNQTLVKIFPFAIINDCRDVNAMSRQETRLYAQLAKVGIVGSIKSIGVEYDFEAAFNLIDQIDAIEECSGGISTNVAPRDGEARKHTNGTDFCFFQYKKIGNISTVGGATLSLVKKLRLVESVFVIQMGDAVRRMVQDGFISSARAPEIMDSQFRSFDFAPRALAYTMSGKKLCCTEVPIGKIVPDSKPIIAVVDSFGNGKTTVLAKELNLKGGCVETRFGPLPFYKRLTDVPDGVAAIVQGSSGLPGSRFAEIVINGESTAKKLGFKIGDKIFW